MRLFSVLRNPLQDITITETITTSDITGIGEKIMASISKDKNGTKRLVFNDHNGKRHFVRLGAVNAKQAELVKSRVEAITSAKRSWVCRSTPKHHAG